MSVSQVTAWGFSTEVWSALSSSCIFTTMSILISVLLLHIWVKQPDMWKWPPSWLVKNEWTCTSTPFYTFIITLATGRTSPWRISAWKFRKIGGDFQKSFWLLVVPRSISVIVCDWTWNSGITQSIILRWKLWPKLFSNQSKHFLINKTAQHLCHIFVTQVRNSCEVCIWYCYWGMFSVTFPFSI
jgi:hypothetical protein